MAKKSEFLSKKERKLYGRLIAAKLDGLGMQDDVMFIQFKGPGGVPAMRKYVDATGKVLFESPIGKLSNPYRNLIRRLRSMPRSVVQEFLRADVGGQKDAKKDAATPTV